MLHRESFLSLDYWTQALVTFHLMSYLVENKQEKNTYKNIFVVELFQLQNIVIFFLFEKFELLDNTERKNLLFE